MTPTKTIPIKKTVTLYDIFPKEMLVKDRKHHKRQLEKIASEIFMAAFETTDRDMSSALASVYLSGLSHGHELTLRGAE